MKWFYLAITLILSIPLFGQSKEETIDSLKQVIENTDSDSTKIAAYYAWDNLIYIEDPETDREIHENIIEICENNLKKKNLPLEETRFFAANLSASLNIIGLILSESGNYMKAQDYFKESLEIAEMVGDSAAMSGPYNNMGMIYELQGFTEEAITYYEKAMALDGENNKRSKAIYLNNIGLGYAKLGKDELALQMYFESVQLSQEVDDPYNEANALGNIGEIYYGREVYDSALAYYEKAYEINIATNYLRGYTHNLEREGMVNYRLGNTKRAIELCESALEQVEGQDIPSKEMECHNCLYFAYKQSGNSNKALYHMEKYNEFYDSLLSDENKMTLQQTKYELEYAAQKMTDSIKVVNQAKIKEVELQADLKKKESQQYLLFGGIGVLLIVGGLIFRGYRQKQKDNEIIAQQKMEVEEKNNEILDSITYAKRIQEAILPPDRLMKEFIPDHFILYKPKDIVAGDFYWLEKVGNRIFLAIADCTGHGVPGAMVSVVCHNALNRAVREFKLTDPGKILDKTRELVIQTFERSEENVKDGMDIALCTWIEGESDLQYSGANNSLYMVRSGEEPELTEIKADKQPIGAYSEKAAFRTHQVQLTAGDKLYAFTDGFADQFGGDKGKKYKYKSFKTKLTEISQLPFDEQKVALNQEFESWKGQLEQLDDVCVLGMSLSS
jgi:serine phosphatase RsbU (regulator of sigma subunit)/Tfp pilus assembly protein PilF